MTGSDVTEWIFLGGIVTAVGYVIVAVCALARHLVSWCFIMKAIPRMNTEEGFQIKSGSVTVDQHGTKNPSVLVSPSSPSPPVAVPPRRRTRRKASLPASAAPGPSPSLYPPSSLGPPP